MAPKILACEGATEKKEGRDEKDGGILLQLVYPRKRAVGAREPVLGRFGGELLRLWFLPCDA